MDSVDATSAPVLTATEAEFALPRGAALASARAATVPDEPVEKPRISRVGVLSSVLAAAVVVFVAGGSAVSRQRPARARQLLGVVGFEALTSIDA